MVQQMTDNFLRRLCLPKAINDWSLRSLQVKLIKIGGWIVRHARRFVFRNVRLTSDKPDKVVLSCLLILYYISKTST